MRILIIAFLLLALAGSVDGVESDQTTEGGAASIRQGAQVGETEELRGAWFRDSRFAMFIHWGLYSELGNQWNGTNYYGIAEWIMNRAQIPVDEYAQIASRFNPTNFDASQWVGLAKAAGMGRIMITAKHHDGFAMYDSDVSPYNIVDATPFQRDPLKELSKACQAEGIRLGFYYSQTADWHERNAMGNTWDWPEEDRDFELYLNHKAAPQVIELLQGYGDLAGIWFDTPGPISPNASMMLVELVRKYQPHALINSRIGNDLGDYETLGDQEIPSLPRAGLWESIDTHNDTWAYAIMDHNWKSAREVAERLVRVVSCGGTYMLNVGPDGTGRIPDQSAQILREVGRWVHAHQQAIDGTDASPFLSLGWGECTRRGNTLFLYVFQWPSNGRLIVPGLKSKVKSGRLAGGDPLLVEQADTHVMITLPRSIPSELIPIVELELAEPVSVSRDLFILNGCQQTLETGLATLKDCKVEKVRWMEKFGDWKHAVCLGNWQGPESSATWNFDTLEPAQFYLDVDYTCPVQDDYSEWRVRCGGTDLTFPLIDTGERDERKAFDGALPRFRTYRVGMIDFPELGAQQLRLSPTGSTGQGIRISALRLIPVGKLPED